MRQCFLNESTKVILSTATTLRYTLGKTIYKLDETKS